jgi:hypothetical protein
VTLLAAAAFGGGCAPGQDKNVEGSLAARLSSSRSAADLRSADDPVSRLRAVNASVSGVEARRLDGVWVPVQRDLPIVVDLLALANVGDTVTLPGDLLPEGQYSALQLRINQLELTKLDGSHVTIAPQGRGWLVLVPADFGIDIDQATVVELNVRLDQSFRLVNGEFEFDPNVEVDGIEREGRRIHG